MSDKLSQYGQNQFPPLEKRAPPQVVGDLEEYQAAGSGKVKERYNTLMIEFRDGGFKFFNYNHLIEGSYKDGFLTLITSTRNYLIEGQNLQLLAELLSERRVKILREFNERRFTRPAGADAILITSIKSD